MPKSALDNPLILPILGLLVERPRHPYAVFAELRRRFPLCRGFVVRQCAAGSAAKVT